jgi:type II secretory pathway predicted ATPase ExeA
MVLQMKPQPRPHLHDSGFASGRSKGKMVNSIKQFVNVNASEARAFFENEVVWHPRLLAYRDGIRHLHARVIPDEQGRAAEGHVLLVGGESGSGKTFGLKQYLSVFPRISREDIERGNCKIDDLPPDVRETIQVSDYWPVLYAEANKSTTNRGLAATLYEAFGYKAQKSWSTPVLLNELKRIIKDCHTELIIVDEAHHLINHQREEITEADVDFVKSLSNQFHVQIVLAGLPRILDMGEAMQMHRRKEPDIILEPYHWLIDDEKQVFTDVVSGPFENIRLPNAAVNLSDHFMQRLYVASGGYIGMASKHLSAALGRAIERDASEISMLLHAEVYHDFIKKKKGGSTRLKNWETASDVSIHSDERARNPFLANDAQISAMIDALAQTGFATPADAATHYSGATAAKTGLRGKARKPYSPLEAR